jgi:hypothetical protein
VCSSDLGLITPAPQITGRSGRSYRKQKGGNFMNIDRFTGTVSLTPEEYEHLVFGNRHTDHNTVTHIQENGKYRIKIEKAAGVKTGDGFTVEANADSLADLWPDIDNLYQGAQKLVKPSVPETTPAGGK